MQKRTLLSEFSKKEKRTLFLYFLGTLGAIGLCVVFGLFGTLLPTVAAPLNRAEIALLVPLSGPQAQLGQAILQTAETALANAPPETGPGNLQLTLVPYDTRGTSDGTSSAALKAARNPSTVTIVSLLDARQTLAAAETIRGYSVPLIIPASTTSSLGTDQFSSLYRIPAQDTMQGEAIVQFLAQELKITDIFLIAESSTYTGNIVATFNNTAQENIKVLGTLDLGQEQLPDDLSILGTRITDSQAKAVVFFGGVPTAQTVLRTLDAAELDIPMISIDSLNDPAISGLVLGRTPVYYTSPILALGGLPEDESLAPFRQALGEQMNKPYAYETTQAIWMVMAALRQMSGNQTPREAAWEYLPNVSTPGQLRNPFFSHDGNGSSAIYIYQATIQWETNPIIYIYGTR